jgi:hypothetical protein
MGDFKKLWCSLRGESKAAARERHRLLVVRLDRANEHGENLDRLRNCTAEQPCRLEACPKCVRWFRREYLRAFLKVGLADGTFTRLSIILGGQAVRPGEFQAGWLVRLVGAVRKQVERSELNGLIVVGGIDLSYNTFENTDEWWIPHAYFLINAPWSLELGGVVRRAFRLCLDARRPIDLAPVDPNKLLSCVTYSLKNGFYRRSSYMEPDRLRRDGTPRTNVRPQSLSPGSDVELARALAEYSVGSRLIMRNVRRTTSPTSDHVELALMRPLVRA